METKLPLNYKDIAKTIRDELDIRVIIAFDEEGMAVITVMYVGGE